MRRTAPTLPVTGKMLQHFAAITLVITAGLAMFASGENSSLIADQVKQRELENQALRAAREKSSQRTVVVDGLRLAPGTRLASAQADGDSPDSAPGVNIVAPTSDFPAASGYGRVGASPPVYRSPAGVVRDESDALAPPPPEIMRQRGRPGQPGQAQSRRPTQDDVDAMIQASAERSGRGSSE